MPALVPVPPSGQQHEIASGPYRATVTEVGASLRTLTHDGRDLVAGWPADAVRPLFRGAVLAPWPNRVGDGSYAWDGEQRQLALTEPERACALHGLVAWLGWHLVERDAASVVLATRLWPQQGYPHLLDLRATYALDDGGLTWTLAATNAGLGTAPYGCSVHPYLVAGAGRVDDWTLDLPASRHLDVDPDRLLPRPGGRDAVHDAVRDVEPGSALDVRGGRSLAGVQLDTAFTGVAAGDDGTARAVVRAADGSGVVMTWDAAALPWVQVHTADRPEPEHHRVGLAVEPMTCPPDALASGTDLVALAPGQAHEATWRLSALGHRAPGAPTGQRLAAAPSSVG